MSLPLSAAFAASAAVGDLLTVTLEGDLPPLASWYGDTIPQLADALKMTIEHAATSEEATKLDAEGRELVGQLQGALVRFLEGWA